MAGKLEGEEDLLAEMTRRLGPLFDSLSKNVPKTLSTLQSKTDKYVAMEELAEAKRMRRGRDDKRKEPNTRRTDYRDEARNNIPDRDSRCLRRSCMRSSLNGLENSRPLPGKGTRRSTDNVPRIYPRVATHKLFIDPDYPLVRQKRRKFSSERLKVIKEEVAKLIKADVIIESHYLDWLADVVVAPKKGGKYHQIKMHLLDVEKTFFITERGLYCYKVMPFGLKNTRATYQRLVNRMFRELIGKTMEVYINDMLVKSLKTTDHIAHLEEAFGMLRKHRMVLNPSKCIFGVFLGKFLGFLVTKRGIEANPNQIQALLAMSSPRNIHEILRKNQAFQWSDEFEAALQHLKEYLSLPPLLTVPVTGKELIVYLFISPTTAHPITVLTNQPLKQILQRPDTSGKLLKWSIELSEFYIDYRPRMAIKAQALINFVAEFTYDVALELGKNLPKHGCGAWLVFQTPLGEQMEYTIRIGFKATNNEDEYEALFAGLRVAMKLGVDSLDAFSDSQLVVSQVQGDYLAKDTRMLTYLEEVKNMFGRSKT
ncbi:hypothetical protein Acr_00g0053630 [Actinidia rufa]|uniref:Retrovirus-related Pol polyprotein from transposon 17.6 n=1 Tax=Actinidia rufa TaxID=165716 RepID=A0A7J0DND3_9ERIC|nr:hypothetical protein Acr_00g0053630 [Actinidia rufa]